MKTIVALITIPAALTLAACAPETEPLALPTPTASAPTGGEPTGGASTSGEPRVKLVAERVEVQRPPGLIHTSGPVTCVKIVVTNVSAKNVEVRPDRFGLIDAANGEHDQGSANGEYENPIGGWKGRTIAPDEMTEGVMCAEGAFVPKEVVMKDPFEVAGRAPVS